MNAPNKAIYIIAAIVLVAALGWINIYDYMPDSSHGMYRINRLTHQVYYDINGDGWMAVKGEGFDISTAKPSAHEYLYEDVVGDEQPGFHPLKE